MNENLDEHLGFKGIIKTYGWKDFFKDSFVPLVLALIVFIAAIICCDDSHELFDKVIALCVSILPSYLGLLVAAYTILLTLLTTDAVTKLKTIVNETNGLSGKDLIRKLNSGFAVCVMIGGLALFLSFLFSVISSLNIVISYADAVNYFGVFLTVFLLAFSLTTLVGIIEDLFNIGQTTTIL